MGPSGPGQLVNPAGPRTQALVTQGIYRPRGHSDTDRVARESWSNLRDLGPWHELSRPAGELAGPRTGFE